MIIRKREGYLAEYDIRKIGSAITKAMEESGEDVGFMPTILAGAVNRRAKQYAEELTVELIQDWIEEELMDAGLKQTAKVFIKYRQKRTEIRERGWQMDDLQRAIWENKYRVKNETFEEWVERVSGGNPKIGKLIRQKKFLFAGRILAHRGLTDKKITYSNCYVIPAPEDNLESIFDTAKLLARTYSYGGGCGVDLSKLRPKGAKVNNSAKETSGAPSFMQLYDLTTGLIGQNGRRGALMISLADYHPDITDFLDIKTEEGSITKANISIRVSDDFMSAVVDDRDWMLHWEGEGGRLLYKEENAKELFGRNAKNNWDWAEPGMLFWDRISSWHLMSEHPDHEFAGVNPCAEEPLMAGGSCLLGSLNLSEFVVHPFTDRAYFDYDKFSAAVKIAVEGLNEVLDEGLPLHPLQIQRDNARDWRQIGLGIMGLADMLVKMGIPYGSDAAVGLSDAIGSTLLNKALESSALLAREHGPFPKYSYDALRKSEFYRANARPEVAEVVRQYGLRNSQILTIAPTGSISTMWGISGGIEPIFATSFERKTESLHGGDVTYKVNTPIVGEYLAKTGKKEVPTSLFRTAHDVHWIDRVRMQAVWQKYIDASISSTVNLPKETTVKDVENLFLEAWGQGLKGITIFRDGCKRTGILTVDDPEAEEPDTMACPECGELIEVHTGGCSICMHCGYTPCN